MKFELKNIKHSEFMSQETNAYQATLYVDGKRTAIVSNEGQGGPDNIMPIKGGWKEFKPAYDKITAYCKTLPKTKFKDMEWHQDLESICGKILTEHLIRRDMKKALRTKVLFTTDKGISYFKIGKHPKQNVIDHCKKQYPRATILNELSEDDALKIWRKN
jgi:hypothetical protein